MINDYAIKRECDWKKTCACGNDSGYVLCSVISLLQTVDKSKRGKKIVLLLRNCFDEKIYFYIIC